MDKDGKPQATWKTKTCMMIEKVAIVRALKEAMTEEFGGTYAAEEFGDAEEDISSKVEDAPPEIQKVKTPEKEAKAQEAEFVEVDDSTGEVIEEDDDDAEFREMQDSFFN